jgi:transcriptional regulator with XRE-family HTH domain
MPRRKSSLVKKSEIAIAVGKQIFAHRKMLGLTQERFAELVGLSKNYIGNLERGEYEISISRLEQIGRALGTNASSLLRNAGF